MTRTFLNFGWALLNALAQRGSLIVANALASHILKQHQFGQLGMFYSSVGLMAQIVSMGLAETTTRFASKITHADPARAVNIAFANLFISASLATLLLIPCVSFACEIANLLLQDEKLAFLVLIGSICLILSSAIGVLSGFAAGIGAFRQIARANLLSGAWIVCMLPIGSLYLGLSGAILAYAAGQLVVLLALASSFWKFCQEAGVKVASVAGAMSEIPALAKFAAPAFLSGISVQAANWVVSYWLSRQPDGFGLMAGMYAVNQLFFAAMFLPTVLGQVTLPAISKANLHDPKHRYLVVRFVLTSSALVLVPILIGVILSPEIINLYRGADVSWVSCLRLSLLATLFVAATVPLGQVLISSGMVWVSALTNAVWSLLFVFGSYHYLANGLAGVAAVRLSTYALHFGLSAVIVCIFLWRNADQPS